MFPLFYFEAKLEKPHFSYTQLAFTVSTYVISPQEVMTSWGEIMTTQVKILAERWCLVEHWDWKYKNETYINSGWKATTKQSYLYLLSRGELPLLEEFSKFITVKPITCGKSYQNKNFSCLYYMMCYKSVIEKCLEK